MESGNKSRTRFCAAMTLLALAGAAMAPAHAAIVGTTGAVLEVAAPASLLEGQTESDTNIIAFDEQQGVVLQNNLNVDWVAPTYMTSGAIAAGTRVNSHFLHLDPVDGGAASSATLSGTITFDGIILGLIFSDRFNYNNGEAVGAGYLDQSDPILGLGTTVYPTNLGRRFDMGNEASSADSFSVSGNQLTFSLTSFTADAFLDQIRIVTAAPAPVPLPAAAWLLLSGLVGFAALGRRKSA